MAACTKHLMNFAGEAKNNRMTNPGFTKQECIDMANEISLFVLYQYVRTTTIKGEFPYLPVDQLLVGERYLCDARNFVVGTWNGKDFDYMRTKFGNTFKDQEKHWDTGAPFGTVKPVMLASEILNWKVPRPLHISKDEADIGLVALECVESELPEYESLLNKLQEISNA